MFGIEQGPEGGAGSHFCSSVVLGFNCGVPCQQLQIGHDPDNPDAPDLFDAVRDIPGQGNRFREAPGPAGALFPGRLPAEGSLKIKKSVAVKILESPRAGKVPVASVGVSQIQGRAEEVRELEQGASSLFQEPLPNPFQHLGRRKGLLESRDVVRDHARKDGRFFPACLGYPDLGNGEGPGWTSCRQKRSGKG